MQETLDRVVQIRAASFFILARLKTDVYLLLYNTNRDDREGIAKSERGVEKGV